MMVSRWWLALLLLCACLGARNLSAQECKPSSPEQVAAQLDQARTRMYFVKYEEARALLKAAEEMLPCLTGPALRVDLSRLFFYVGISAFNTGNADEARDAFRKAVAINPDLRWDERFGSKPRDAFNLAKEEVISAPRGTLTAPELKPNVVIYLDGEMKAPGPSSVLPGAHYVQLKADDRFAFGQVIPVGRGESKTIDLPAEYVARPTQVTRPTTGTGEPPSIGTVEPTPVDREPFDKTKLRPVSYVVMGSAGLALLAGTGLGIYTNQLQAQLREEYYSVPGLGEPGQEERDALFARQKTTAWAANGSFAAAVVLGGVGATLFLLSRPVETTEGGEARVVPFFGPGGAGLAWYGTF